MKINTIILFFICSLLSCNTFSKEKIKCKGHGEIPIYTGPGHDMSVQCCKKLTHRIQKKYYDKSCTNLFEKFGGGGYIGICLACGDKKCDFKFETKCNCPEDCK